MGLESATLPLSIVEIGLFISITAYFARESMTGCKEFAKIFLAESIIRSLHASDRNLKWTCSEILILANGLL